LRVLRAKVKYDDRLMFRILVQKSRPPGARVRI
jgi:hypothetical protein